jgi:hypothetical protein
MVNCLYGEAMKVLIMIISLFGYIFTCSSCHAQKRIIANQCFLIDTVNMGDNNLISALDSFAAKYNLKVVKSDPANFRYKEYDGSSLVSEIMLTRGMGKFGSVITIYLYDKPIHYHFLYDFKMMLRTRLSHDYGIKQCSDVPGFEIPRIYK